MGLTGRPRPLAAKRVGRGNGMTLNDLMPDRWQRIAVGQQDRRGEMRWSWLIEDRDVLPLALEGGSVLTAQRRVGGGIFELLGKLRRVG